MGKGVMGMDDGLSDLADLSQLMGSLTLDPVVLLQKMFTELSPMQSCSILVSLSNNDTFAC